MAANTTSILHIFAKYRVGTGLAQLLFGVFTGPFLSHAEVHMIAKSPEAPPPLTLLLLRLLPDPNID